MTDRITAASAKRPRNGSSLIELIMVMTLLTLFGSAIFALVVAGSSVQERIMNNKSAQVDARIALSYINVKLRQNDKAGKIQVQPCPVNGSDAIVIRNRSEELNYDVWVFFHEGVLYEFMGYEGIEPDLTLSIKVLEIQDLDIAYDGATGLITATVAYDYSGERKTMSESILLKSAGL